MGEKQKLTITRCEVTPSGETNVIQGDTFEALFNPASYSHAHSINYTQSSGPGSQGANQKPQGQVAADSKFAAYNAEKISFDLVLDGTGVAKKDDSSVPDVKSEIDDLKEIVYRYVGEEHEPSVVKLTWGAQDPFYGRMESMAIDYNLFKPSGEPLRAKVKLSFSSFMSSMESSLRASRSSPDMSHMVEVRDGDTLPLLCQRVYSDCGRYLDVARANRLANFRQLEPGTWLRFPPLT